MSPAEPPGPELGRCERHEHVWPEDGGGLAGLRGPGLHVPSAWYVDTDEGHAESGQALQDGQELGPDWGPEAEPEDGVYDEAVGGGDVFGELRKEEDVRLPRLVLQIMVQLLVCLLGVVDMG